jgi:hypothetical protein
MPGEGTLDLDTCARFDQDRLSGDVQAPDLISYRSVDLAAMPAFLSDREEEDREWIDSPEG